MRLHPSAAATNPQPLRGSTLPPTCELMLVHHHFTLHTITALQVQVQVQVTVTQLRFQLQFQFQFQFPHIPQQIITGTGTGTGTVYLVRSAVTCATEPLHLIVLDVLMIAWLLAAQKCYVPCALVFSTKQSQPLREKLPTIFCCAHDHAPLPHRKGPSGPRCSFMARLVQQTVGILSPRFPSSPVGKSSQPLQVLWLLWRSAGACASGC